MKEAAELRTDPAAKNGIGEYADVNGLNVYYEIHGAGRNWESRYAWPLYAAIGIAAYHGVGLDDRARAFH